MSLRFIISNVNSSNFRIKKYIIKVYSDDDFLPVYEYSRSSTSYNGIFIPSYSTILSEATKMTTFAAFSCSKRNDYNSILNLSISNNRLTNLSSLSPKNSDVLGAYINSSSVSTAILHRQTHYYKYGYVQEEFLTKNLSLNLVDGELLTGMVSSSFTVGYVTCVTLVIKYFITSLPTLDETLPDCPYTYKLYTEVRKGFFGKYRSFSYLSILKNSTVVFNEHLRNFSSGGVDISSDATKNYARKKLKIYIDECISNSDTRIKTTCCLLVCCEPNKYKLI